jgi:hypothetical protein
MAGKEPLEPEAFALINEYAAKAAKMPEGPEKKALVDKLTKVGLVFDPPAEPVGMGITAHALKLLNWVPQTANALVGKGVGLATGKNIVSNEELSNQLNPLNAHAAPISSEMMTRGGVPEMGRAGDLPLVGSHLPDAVKGITGRGALGFLLDMAPGIGLSKSTGKILSRGDMALEGLTAPEARALVQARIAALKSGGAPGGVSTLEKLSGALLDPAGTGVPMAGRAIYRSTMGAADRKALADTGQRFSDLAREGGVWGSQEGRLPGIDKMIEAKSAANRGIVSSIDDVANNSARVPEEQLFGPMYDYLKTKQAGGNPLEAIKVKNQITREQAARRGATSGPIPEGGDSLMVTNPETGQVELMDRRLENTPPIDSVGIQNINRLKQDWQGNARRNGAYADNFFANPQEKAKSMVEGGAYKQGANAAARSVEDLADEVRPGAGGDIYSNNRDIQTLLTGEGELPNTGTPNVPAIRSLAPYQIMKLLKNYAEVGTTGGGLAASKLPPTLLQAMRAGTLDTPTATEMRKPQVRSPWLDLLQERK